MFTAPLSPTGFFPASHYISSGLIEDTFAALLPLTTFDDEGNAGIAPGNVAAIAYLADQAGLTVSADVIATLLAACDVSEQDPFAAMSRLGLGVCADEAP